MIKIKQPQLIEANLSHQQIKAAIPKIERRIVDLDSFDIDSVNDKDDVRINALSKS